MVCFWKIIIMSNIPSIEDLNNKIDDVMEDLIVGHNFEYAGQALKDLFTTHIQAVAEEIVGKDEHYATDTFVQKIAVALTTGRLDELDYRNGLRKEQRQRLNQYLGKGK